MRRKLIEKKFPNDAEATSFLLKAGYHYCGRKGLFKKYHLYEGLQVIYWDNVLGTYSYIVKSYDDGYVVVYSNDKIDNGIISISQIPDKVSFNLDLYNHIEKQIDEFNAELRDIFDLGKGPSDWYLKIEWGKMGNEYTVYKVNLGKAKKGEIGRTLLGDQELKVFENYPEAYNWAKLNYR